MAKRFGKDCLLWIESTTPGTYNLIKGQVSLSYEGNGDTIDISTKDDGAYKSMAMAQRSVQISGDLLPDLPDATGYTRFETLAQAAPAAPFNVQIRKGGAAGNATTDVIFAGSVYAINLSKSYGKDDAVKVSFSLGLNGAPVTDALA